MTALDQNMLKRFVRLAADELRGDWVIIGGTVLPLLGIMHRTTVDIEIAGPEDTGQEQIVVLMEIAERLGLPVEAINQAGAYFLRKIDGWETMLEILRKGKKAIVYRPDVTLFILLKLQRLTESDLSDCLEFLRFAAKQNEPLDLERVGEAIEGLLQGGISRGKERRLDILRGALARF